MTDSKDHILRKTFYLLLVKGYDGVSITDIQKETGLSRGLLYHYYGSKEDLFGAACEKFLNEVFLIDIDEVKGYGLPQMIDYIIDKYQNIYKIGRNDNDSEKITIANYDFLVYQMMTKNDKLAAQYSSMRRHELNTWQKAVEISLAGKEIKSVLSSDKVAGHIVTLLDGLWLQAVESKDSKQYTVRIKSVLSDYYEMLKLF